MLSFSVVEEAWRKRWCPSADRHLETMKIGRWWTDEVRRLARCGGSVPLPRAGKMPARPRAGRPRHDFQSSRCRHRHGT